MHLDEVEARAIHCTRVQLHRSVFLKERTNVDGEKYTRTVSLQCPTCGGTEFSGPDSHEVFTCARCARTLTRDELVHENSENMNAHLEELAEDVKKDAIELLKKDLQAAFKGSSVIRVK
jgi:hypothetical protein